MSKKEYGYEVLKCVYHESCKHVDDVVLDREQIIKNLTDHSYNGIIALSTAIEIIRGGKHDRDK